MGAEAQKHDIRRVVGKNFVLLGARREVRRLHLYLHEDEVVLDAVTGSRLGKRGRGLIVATNERVLIIWDGWVFRENQDFPYETIGGVEFKVGLFFGVLTVYGKGDETSYNWVGRKSGSMFVKTVRQLVAKSSLNPTVGVGRRSTPSVNVERPAVVRSVASETAAGAVGGDGVDMQGDGSLSARIDALIKARNNGLISFEEFEEHKNNILKSLG